MGQLHSMLTGHSLRLCGRLSHLFTRAVRRCLFPLRALTICHAAILRRRTASSWANLCKEVMTFGPAFCRDSLALCGALIPLRSRILCPFAFAVTRIFPTFHSRELVSQFLMRGRRPFWLTCTLG